MGKLRNLSMQKLNWGALSVAAACLIMIAVTIYTLIHVSNQQTAFNGNSPQTSGAVSAAFPNLTKRSFAEFLVNKIDKAYIRIKLQLPVLPVARPSSQAK